MKIVCRVCERGFEAKRPSAKYCGERCRKQAQRRPGSVVALPARVAEDGPMVAATRRGLESVGRVDTELGAAVLLLAERLDRLGLVDTGAGVAAMVKEYRATLAEAVKDADRANDPLEDIRGSAALKLIVNS